MVYATNDEQLATKALTYDASPNPGFLTLDCQLQVSECKYYGYDSICNVNVDLFTPSANTPERDTTYDSYGRTVRIAQSGGDAENYTFDLDGRLTKAAKVPR